MTRKKAKKALEIQRVKLNESFQFGDSIWLNTIMHYIEQIFSKESIPSKAISNFRPFDAKYASESFPIIRDKLNKMFDDWTQMIDQGVLH